MITLDGCIGAGACSTSRTSRQCLAAPTTAAYAWPTRTHNFQVYPDLSDIQRASFHHLAGPRYHSRLVTIAKCAIPPTRQGSSCSCPNVEAPSRCLSGPGGQAPSAGPDRALTQYLNDPLHMSLGRPLTAYRQPGNACPPWSCKCTELEPGRGTLEDKVHGACSSIQQPYMQSNLSFSCLGSAYSLNKAPGFKSHEHSQEHDERYGASLFSSQLCLSLTWWFPSVLGLLLVSHYVCSPCIL
jgi:hypothetical protein